MKRIVNYKTFINESSDESTLNAEQIDFLNKYADGTWKLNDSGAVDVVGNFVCSDRGISDFKGISFGKVTGYFDCSYNNLTSLEGCPKEVGAIFDCTRNKLTSLEFGPKEVGAIFDCSRNKLTSLEGCPQKVGGTFDCSRNKLTSLEFGPKEVGGHFYCSSNNLTSLEFSPDKVDADFFCSNNNLISLEGASKKVGGAFRCSYNEGVSTETLKLIYSNILSTKSDYETVLKSLWKEIPIEDKILLYTPDLGWFDPEEASKLVKLKRYNAIKKMI